MSICFYVFNKLLRDHLLFKFHQNFTVHMTTMTLLSCFCVIVLRSQVFNLIRALNVRSASYKLAGDNKSKRRSISTCGNIIRTNSTTILEIQKRIMKIYSPFIFSPLYPAKPIFSSLLCLDMLQN